MTDLEQSTFNCPHCEYRSQYRCNLYRHTRAKHPNQPITSPPQIESPPPLLSSEEPPNVAIDDGDDMSYSDLEEMIDMKIRDVLENQGMPVPQGVRKGLVKNMMSSRGATIAATLCISYLLLANAPLLIGGIKSVIAKNSLAPSQGGGMSQQEMMTMLLAQQQQQATSQMSQSSRDDSDKSEPTLAD